MTEQHVVSISQAAKTLHVSRSLIWRRIRSGEIPSFASERDRRVTLVRLSDLAALDPNQPLRRKEIAA